MWYFKACVLILFLFFTGCNSKRVRENNNGIINNKYSGRFSITPFDGYSRISVYDPWQGAEGRHFDYYVCHDSTALPAGIDKSSIIMLPVERIVCTSTTHIAMLEALDAVDMVVGVSGSDYVYNLDLRERIDNGDIYDIGYEIGYDTELIYSIDPDIIFVYGVGSESVPAFNRLSEKGISVIYIADYLEEHPLARTEWIKVYGELLGLSDMAAEVFDTVSAEYNLIQKKIDSYSADRPGVMLGLPFKDKWFISPGNSYISKLIHDAGGEYLWSETKSNTSIPMSLEAVVSMAAAADIWLNTGIAASIRDIELVDHRLANLPVITQSSVYNNNNRLNKYGGNDYWESGTVNPHLILKDIASIINPDLFPGHELIYYTKLKDTP